MRIQRKRIILNKRKFKILGKRLVFDKQEFRGRKMINEYKNQLLYFIKSKKYMISIIITFILSFGYAITHESIGMDDISFDRYVSGMYWLSSNRFGLWLIYNILNLKEFTPFWLDFMTALIVAVISITLCLFVRKNFGKLVKSNWVYVIFSCLLISNPLINNFYTFQVSSLALSISNLLSIILGILVFENYFNKPHKRFKLILLSGLVLSTLLSTYESCAQTYLVFVFLSFFLKSISDRKDLSDKKSIKENNKKLIKYFFINIAIIVIGIIAYYLINALIHFILKQNGLLVPNYASTGATLLDKNFISNPWLIKVSRIDKFLGDFIGNIKSYFPITIFVGLFIISMIMEFIKLLKSNNVLRTVSFLGIIFSNFILTILQLTLINRIMFSLIITSAFLGAYIYNYFCTKKKLKYVINVLAILLILHQTKTLNYYFVNDYQRYDREKIIVNSIAVEVVNNYDYENKPLVFIVEKNLNEIQQKYGRIHKENSISIIWWGLTAFEKPQEELIKFVNYFGYSFKYPTKEQIENARVEYKNLQDEEKKNIVEFDDYIVVNLDKYDMFKEYKSLYNRED